MENDPNPTSNSQNEITNASHRENTQVDQETPEQNESQALNTEQQADVTHQDEEHPQETENAAEEEEDQHNDQEEPENNEEENAQEEDQDPAQEEQDQAQEEQEQEKEQQEVEVGKEQILDGLANAILGGAANAENKEEVLEAFGQALLKPAEAEAEALENNNEEENQGEVHKTATEEEQDLPVPKTPIKSSSQGQRDHSEQKEEHDISIKEDAHKIATPRKENITPRVEEQPQVQETPKETPRQSVPQEIPQQTVPQETPQAKKKEEEPKFENIDDALRSVSQFFSITEVNIEKTSASLFSKLTELPALIKKAQEQPKKPVQQEQIQPIAEDDSKVKAIDDHQLRMQRMKEMKRQFESQVNDLNKGLENLDSLERPDPTLHLQEDIKNKKLGPVKTHKKSQADLPLYMRLEKEYQQNKVLPELERRKDALKAKKELYQPMDEKLIREHALKYQEMGKQDQIKREVARMESDKQKAERVGKAQKLYKSVALNKILEQEKEEKAKQDKRFEEIKLMKDRQNQYGKLVKEIYFPKTEQKHEGLTKETIRQLIERSERVHASPPKYMPQKAGPANYEIYPAKNRINRISQEQLRQFEGIVETIPNVPQNQLYGHKGYLYRKAQKHASPPKAASAEEKTSVRQSMVLEDREERSQERRVSEVRAPAEIKKKLSPPRRSGENAVMKKGKEQAKEKEKSPEPEKKSYPNYLEEIKKKRVELEKKGTKAKYVHWEKYMKNKGMTKQEKMINIMDEVGRLEHQMKMKEERLKRLNMPENMQPMELEEQVGEMYLESIKAKLAIIKGFAV